MTQNVGTIDRSLRVIAGIIIAAAGVYFQSWWGLLGLVPLATGSFGWCPAYSIFGLTTCKRK